MILQSKYFNLNELVCPHVIEKYGKRSWQFLDSRLIYTIDTFRERIGKRIFVNTGDLTQRGLRCTQCDIVKAKIEAGELYLSAHVLGKAVDFNVEDMDSDEVRLWIAKRPGLFPYSIRLETGISWVHIDTYPNPTTEKIYFFKP